RYGGHAPPTPFLTEIRAVMANDLTSSLGFLVAKSAWHIFKDSEPAKELMKNLAIIAEGPEATAENVNSYAAAALNLAEIPGVNALTSPVLLKLTTFNDISAARFSSNILARLSEEPKRPALTQ